MRQEIENLKSMSLGDHLEELRLRLILMLIGIFIGFVISVGFGKLFVRALQIPYDNAIAQINSSIDDVIVSDSDTKTAPQLIQPPLTTMGPAEGFKTYLQVSLFFAVLISSPWVIWQIWAFISSGLYKKEKQFAYTVAPSSAILFITGALFFMFIIAPIIMKFFVNFDLMLGVVSRWTLLNYINMVLSLTLIFGVAFQMPIVIVFAERVGLVTVHQLQTTRKFVILGIFFVAAVATPPDVVSQVSLAIPLYALYEGSIIICRFRRAKKQKADSDAVPPAPENQE